MSNGFIPPTPVIDENVPEDPGVICSPEETSVRLELCKSCINFTFRDNHTVCDATGCNISLMTTFEFKQCPLEKW